MLLGAGWGAKVVWGAKATDWLPWRSVHGSVCCTYNVSIYKLSCILGPCPPLNPPTVSSGIYLSARNDIKSSACQIPRIVDKSMHGMPSEEPVAQLCHPGDFWRLFDVTTERHKSHFDMRKSSHKQQQIHILESLNQFESRHYITLRQFASLRKNDENHFYEILELSKRASS